MTYNVSNFYLRNSTYKSLASIENGVATEPNAATLANRDKL